LQVETALPVKRQTTGAVVVAAAAALLWACTTVSAPAPAQAQTAAAPAPAAATSPPNIAPAAAAPTASAAVDPAKGRATFEQLCAGCHEAALATDLRNTRRGWEQVVDRMFGFGMAATDEQVNEVVDYLTANYGAE
jgi:mono/diheme cytochrome c family protein